MTKEQLEQRAKDEAKRAKAKANDISQGAKAADGTKSTKKEQQKWFKEDEYGRMFLTEEGEERLKAAMLNTKSVRNTDPFVALLFNEFRDQLEKERQMREDAMKLVDLSQTIIDEQREIIENYRQLLNIRR